MTISHPGSLKGDPYFQQYIDCVQHSDAIEALEASQMRTLELFRAIPENKESFKYAVRKWTIKQLLQHIIDAEKVFCYRALRLSRKDNTPMAGYHENPYAMNDNSHNLSLSSIIKEYNLVRESTLHFFENISPEVLDFEGTASKQFVSPRILSWIIAGHNIHHLNILEEKYLSI